MGDNEFLCGGLTFVDFAVFEFFDMLQTLKPGYLDQWENLSGLYKRVGELPKIKAYRESDRFQARPFNAPFAKFT